MKLTVIVPVYNEAGNLAGCLARLGETLSPEDEIVVVDDGSTDGTAAEVDGERCVLARHEANMGKGAAIRTGIALARGELIALIDGDGQDDPRDLAPLVEAVEAGADLAVGSRFCAAGVTAKGTGPAGKRYSARAVLPVNELGNRALSAIFSALFGFRATDVCASLRVYRGEALRRMTISADRYDVEIEMMIRAVRMGLSIVEVPVSRHPRGHGRSNLYDVPFGRAKFALQALRAFGRGYFLWR